jgi:peptidoglycan/xylan/chitin deacetylase (PgdA/CDA1 family)
MIKSSLVLGSTGMLGYSFAAHLFTLGCVWRGPRASNAVALTFDDGPDPEYTPRVLDILAARDVRSTFFVVGKHAERFPEAVKLIHDRGHEIASHGWSHRNLWICGPRRTFKEIGRTHETLTALTGLAPALFRPPWGAVNAAMFGALKRYKQRCVFWSVQPEGLRQQSAASQAAYVLRKARPGMIVDLHDAEGTKGAPARLSDALPSMIEGLKERGYRFTTVTDMLSRVD